MAERNSRAKAACGWVSDPGMPPNLVLTMRVVGHPSLRVDSCLLPRLAHGKR